MPCSCAKTPSKSCSYAGFRVKTRQKSSNAITHVCSNLGCAPKTSRTSGEAKFGARLRIFGQMVEYLGKMALLGKARVPHARFLRVGGVLLLRQHSYMPSIASRIVLHNRPHLCTDFPAEFN